jgi:threonine aldolase
VIDLFSDTATRPTAEMRQAIVTARVGDEQRHEDPTVLKLIDATCARLGKAAGLFLPSGTMCNLIAVKTHTQAGDAVFLGHNCHILRCETGAAAAVSGVVLDVVASDNGIFDGKSLEAAIYAANPYTPIPKLVCVEQTHNFAGGAIWPLAKLQEVRDIAQKHNLLVHMDGARLFNAAVGSGISAADYAALCDSVWVDFTKGLGAPLGAVLCGSQEFIERARRYKHMFGGALRQAGMMAAGCLYALENHVERLADDHRRAVRLAECLAGFPDFQVRPVDTNLIFFRPGVLKPEDFLHKMEQRGVKMSSVGEWVRAVTHLDISEADIEQTLEILTDSFMTSSASQR